MVEIFIGRVRYDHAAHFTLVYLTTNSGKALFDALLDVAFCYFETGLSIKSLESHVIANSMLIDTGLSIDSHIYLNEILRIFQQQQ